jgi:uncharacterized protein (DUF2147 family)
MIVLAAFAILSFASQAAPDVDWSGYWTNESASVVVLIAPCGDNAWCGTVQSASKKAQADTRRGGTSELVGTELLHHFRPVAPGRWKGRLFIPDLNRRSSAEIRQLDANRLEVRGCAIGHLLCRSQVWARAAISQP